jgi:nitroreductase
MELRDVLRTTGAVREFRPDPVPDGVVARILDTARFAPSGGNRQAWHVVVVRDLELRRRLRDLYLPGWYEYLAMRGAGLVPWAPVTDAEREREALTHVAEVADAATAGGAGFAEQLDTAPVLLLVFADLQGLAAVDRGFDRYTLVGGASIYPFVWSVLLAARDEGLGGVITTMPVRREPEVKALFAVPDHFAMAALVVLGHPVHQPTRLTRNPIDSFTTVDRFDGPSLLPDSS